MNFITLKPSSESFHRLNFCGTESDDKKKYKYFSINVFDTIAYRNYL